MRCGMLTCSLRELGRVQQKVEEWSSLGRFTKAFLARDHAESLKGYQGIIQTAREEMQVSGISFSHDTIG